MFISFDYSLESFTQYFSKMPWYALDYSDLDKRVSGPSIHHRITRARIFFTHVGVLGMQYLLERIVIGGGVYGSWKEGQMAVNADVGTGH